MSQVSTTVEQFQNDVLRGLRTEPKTLPCKYFYDEAGCALFEDICETPEYYLTRVELQLMQRYAGEIAALLGPDCVIVEYGSGAGVKIRLLLDHLVSPVAYVPVDIAGGHLQEIADQLNHDYPELEVSPVTADFTQTIHMPCLHRRPRSRVVYFPGSTIGNFTPESGVNLLQGMRALAGPQGQLLIGVDLVKNAGVLNAAYNDQQGVTEAFNKNLLARVNRELDGDFDLDAFAHEAFFSPAHKRMEIYLRSLAHQTVHVSGRAFHFRKDERILTEYSHKYDVPTFVEQAGSVGWRLESHWTDERNYFAILLFAQC